MFKSLREKLKSWTKKVSKLERESEAKEILEKKTPPEKIKKSRKEKQKKPEKDIYEKLKETSDQAKETVEIPKNFNPGKEMFEPDLERLKEKLKSERESKDEEITEKSPEKKLFLKNIFSGGGKIKISEKDFAGYRDDLEMILLENNVAFEVSNEIIKKLKEEIIGKEILGKELDSEIKNSLAEIISGILVEPFDFVKRILEKKEQSKDPFIILFFGINGSGKTTSIAKIAELLKKKGLSSVLAAADTFRAASIEQLKEHGSRLGMKVIAHDYGSDPASVGFDAIQYAKKNHIDCVLIDTAGRMHTEKNLIHEMEKISRVCKPDLKIFVGESITGNDATEQAKIFSEKVGIDGIILSKADIDEKGGTALSVGYVTKRPIIFLGIGQNYSDIEPFNKNKFLDKIGL